jgi:two-component system CheB/CheR fusion protein
MDLFRRILPQDPEVERVRAIMERQVLHLTRLIDDLLDVARIKSGRIELQLQRIDVREPLRSAIADMRQAIDAAGHRLVADQAPEPLLVEADEVRVEQVFTNLLHNAIKYTPSGGEIRVSSRRDQGDAVVSIRDTGIGLTPEMQTEIFDLFVQGAHCPDRAPAGLGLGLTLVRRLVELHGGEVDARSEGPGKGTEMTVRLPLADRPHNRGKDKSEPSAPPGAPPGAPPSAPPSAPRESADRQEPATGVSTSAGTKTDSASRRILVVDDVADIAESLALALELAGHEVRQAQTAAQALSVVDDFAPEVVILDIGLPDMDGYALADQLRARPKTAGALLIAISGYGQHGDIDKSRAAGIDHHLTKPARLNMLLELIGQRSAVTPP